MKIEFPYQQQGVRCNGCGQDIFSNSRHDFVTCKCGKTYIDGGFSYIRVGFSDDAGYTSIERTLTEYPPRNFRSEK